MVTKSDASSGMDDFYLISVAARMLGMHPQTLRKYDRLGLIQPSRTIGSMRVYSQDEIERLERQRADWQAFSRAMEAVVT